jgi:hypothetical protein
MEPERHNPIVARACQSEEGLFYFPPTPRLEDLFPKINPSSSSTKLNNFYTTPTGSSGYSVAAVPATPGAALILQFSCMTKTLSPAVGSVAAPTVVGHFPPSE